METISFKKILDAIKKELQKKSIDAVYNNTHEYFDNGNFLQIKMANFIHKQFNLRFYHYELKDKSYDTLEEMAFDLKVSNDIISKYHDKFVYISFYEWTKDNLKAIEKFKEVKNKIISGCVKELVNAENDKNQTTESIKKETEKKHSLLLKIESLQNEISNFSKRKESYENQIQRNLKEIEKIKSTPEFIGKKPYNDRIKDLKEENIKLPNDFEKHNESLIKEFENNKQILQKLETSISELEIQIKDIERKHDQILKKKEFLENDNTSFNIYVEKKYYEELEKMFSGLKALLFYELNLFNESFSIHMNLDYSRIKETLLTRVRGSIPSKTKNNYVEVLRKLNENVFLTLNPYQDTDEVAAIFLAISNSFIDNNSIRTDTGLIYINFGNGILAKLIVRENIDNIEDDIILIGNKTKAGNSSVYKEEYIFCGYSNSGFILNVGIYIITKELVFEIYFNANSLLIDNNYIPLLQVISDSKKKKDMDYELDDD